MTNYLDDVEILAELGEKVLKNWQLKKNKGEAMDLVYDLVVTVIKFLIHVLDKSENLVLIFIHFWITLRVQLFVDDQLI